MTKISIKITTKNSTQKLRHPDPCGVQTALWPKIRRGAGGGWILIYASRNDDRLSNVLIKLSIREFFSGKMRFTGG